MGRILRIELRRSAAVPIGLLLLLAGTGLLLSYPQWFTGRWMALAVTTRSTLMVIWPLALAGGAWLGRREARSRVGELFASTARPRWQRTLPTAGALALTGVAAYALMFAIGAAWVVPASGFFPAATLGVAGVGALSMVAAAWLGMAAGRAVPRLVTAPVLAVVGFGVAGMLPDLISTRNLEPMSAPAAVLLTPVYANSIDDFLTVVDRVSLVQAGWLAALAATGLLLASAARRRTMAVAVLPVVLGGAVAVPLLPDGGFEAAAEVDPVAVELVCDEAGAPVCVRRVHAGLLPDLTDPVRQTLAMLDERLPAPPVRAVESAQVINFPRPYPPPDPVRYPADTLVFHAPSVGPTGRAELDDSYLLLLREAAWWQDCDDDGGLDTYIARRVAAGWLVGEPPVPDSWWSPDERANAEGAYQTLIALPEAEQAARMSAARDEMLACRTDALRSILTIGSP